MAKYKKKDVRIDSAPLAGSDGSFGNCTVSLDALLPLLQKEVVQDDVAGAQYFVTGADIVGHTQDQCVVMSFTFDVYIVSSKPVLVPLLPSSLAVEQVDTSTEGRLVVHNARHTWLAHGSGPRKLTLKVLCPYTNANKCAVALRMLPRCSQHVKFTVVGQQDIDITVDPVLRLVTSVCSTFWDCTLTILGITGTRRRSN